MQTNKAGNWEILIFMKSPSIRRRPETIDFFWRNYSLSILGKMENLQMSAEAFMQNAIKHNLHVIETVKDHLQRTNYVPFICYV